MSNLGTMTAYITADITGLLRGSRSATMAVARMSSNIQRSTAVAAASFTRMGTVMTIGLTAPIVAAGLKITKLASDAEETRSKFNVVFKAVRSEADATARNLSKNYGLSSRASQQLMSDTGDLLTGFGFTGQKALDLSREVNKLAVDLASFTNFSGGAEGASKALTKALLGERESVKSLGISILEKDVKDKVALLRSQGMVFATDRQVKAYATLQIALDQSKNAIGDFARTQFEVANQWRIMKARIEDVAVVLGKAFLPPLNRTIGRVIKLTNAFMVLDPQIQSAVLHFAMIAAAIGPGLLVFGQLLKVVSLVFGVFSILATVLAAFLTPVGLVVGAVAGIIAVVVKLIGPIETLAIVWTVLESTLHAVAGTFAVIVDFFVAKARQLELVSKAAELIGKAWIGLRVVFRLAQAGYAKMVQGILKSLSWLLNKMEKVARFFKLDLADSIKALSKDLNAMGDAAGENADKFVDAAVVASEDWGNAWQTLKTVALEQLSGLVKGSEEKANRLREILNKLKEGIVSIAEDVQVPAGTEGGDTGSEGGDQLPGGPPGQETKDAWDQWLEDQTFTALALKDLWANTWVFMADGMAASFADMITEGESFRDSLSALLKSIANVIIQQLAKWFIANVIFSKKMKVLQAADTVSTIATESTKTAAKAASAAPHPWLIPVFVAAAAMFFAKAVGGSGGGGGGGGGSTPTSTPNVAEAPGSDGGGGGREVNLHISLEGGSRIMTPEERAEEQIRVLDDYLSATGGTLHRVTVAIK